MIINKNCNWLICHYFGNLFTYKESVDSAIRSTKNKTDKNRVVTQLASNCVKSKNCNLQWNRWNDWSNSVKLLDKHFNSWYRISCGHNKIKIMKHSLSALVDWERPHIPLHLAHLWQVLARRPNAHYAFDQPHIWTRKGTVLTQQWPLLYAFHVDSLQRSNKRRWPYSQKKVGATSASIQWTPTMMPSCRFG